MEKQATDTAAAGANHGQTAAGAGKCPMAQGARGRGNRDWWPDALDISALHRNSSLSDPMSDGFDYAKEFQSLDLDGHFRIGATNAIPVLSMSSSTWTIVWPPSVVRWMKPRSHAIIQSVSGRDDEIATTPSPLG